MSPDSAWNEAIKELKECNEFIGSIWRPIFIIIFLLALSIALLIFYNFSENGRFSLNKDGLIIDTRTGNCYLFRDRYIEANLEQMSDEELARIAGVKLKPLGAGVYRDEYIQSAQGLDVGPGLYVEPKPGPPKKK